MSSADSFDQEILKIKNKHKPNSTFSDYRPIQNDPYAKSYEEQLTILEHQYAKMESEYVQQIKQLKHVLQEKSRKQATLTKQISFLREEFRLHQEQITKVSEELITQASRQIEVRQQKKNPSPGLIKKSLQIEKKNEKKFSPSTHTINKNIFLQDFLNKGGQNSSPTSKRASPKNNSPGLMRLLKNQPTPLAASHKYIAANQPNESKQTIQKSSGDNKKAYSPTSSQNIKLGLLGAKQSTKAGNCTVGTNPSPKRLVRRSPGQKVPISIQLKKDGKLGRLKETMQEVF